MSLDASATNIKAIKTTLVRVIRDNMFGGEELALLEPYNGPRPTVLHASIMFISATAEMHEVIENDDREEGYFEELRGESYCRLRITFCGDGANQKAVDCRNLLRSTNRIFDLGINTGYGIVQDIQDTSVRYLGRIEEQAILNVEFYANLSAEFESDYIETVQGDIVRDGNEPLPYEITREQ